MNFDELLKTLHQDYLASLPKKISLIESQITAGAVTDLRESFHKLKGTGRTYGMPEISDLAALVEAVCLQFPERAVTAAGLALDMMREIHAARRAGQEHKLEKDTRMDAVRKLLQK